jgi:hypothetical protein
LTTIFDLSKNYILRDLIMIHKCRVFLTVVENSILYTKVEKFMIIARAPRLEPEARRGL